MKLCVCKYPCLSDFIALVWIRSLKAGRKNVRCLRRRNLWSCPPPKCVCNHRGDSSRCEFAINVPSLYMELTEKWNNLINLSAFTSVNRCLRVNLNFIWREREREFLCSVKRWSLLINRRICPRERLRRFKSRRPVAVSSFNVWPAFSAFSGKSAGCFPSGGVRVECENCSSRSPEFRDLCVFHKKKEKTEWTKYTTLSTLKCNLFPSWRRIVKNHSRYG